MNGKQPSSNNEDFDKLSGSFAGPNDRDALSRNLLEDKIQAEIDTKLEERFCWILAFLILFDSHFLMSASNFSGPLVVGLLELILLFIFAKKLGVDEVLPFIDKVLSIVARSSENGKSH